MYPCDILGKAVVYGIHNDSHKTESVIKLQSKSSDSVNCGTYRCCDGNYTCVGSCKIQLSGEADYEWNNRTSICAADSRCGYSTYTSDNNQRLAWSIFAKFGIKIAYTRLGIIFALIFVGIPFVVRAVQPVLEKVDIQYEEAANMLGATNRQTVFRIILPEILPALIGGFTMSFARGLGEYGSVVFIAGNTPYETEIAPLMIMSKLQEYDYASATSIALVMLFIAFAILFINAVLQSRTSKIVSGIS